MQEESYLTTLRRSLWYLLAGTRGGITRIRIIMLLRERPYNANQIKDALELDYKTVQHHLKVLSDERVISTSEEKKYGSMYFLSPLLDKNMYIIDEILDKTGENKLNRRRKR